MCDHMNICSYLMLNETIDPSKSVLSTQVVALKGLSQRSFPSGRTRSLTGNARNSALALFTCQADALLLSYDLSGNRQFHYSINMTVLYNFKTTTTTKNAS